MAVGAGALLAERLSRVHFVCAAYLVLSAEDSADNVQAGEGGGPTADVRRLLDHRGGERRSRRAGHAVLVKIFQSESDSLMHNFINFINLQRSELCI